MSLKVVIAGDVYPVRLESNELAQRLGLVDEPDLFVWSLDAAIDAGPPRPDYSCLAFEPESLDGLKLGKANLVVAASNHITDFGAGGVAAALAEFSSRGMRHAGVGMDRRQADELAVCESPEGRIGVLAFAETHPRVYALAAGESTAGVRPFDADACLAAIAAAAKQVDWVWVALHWGEEFVRYPDPEQRRLAWRMVDAGASLVFASHTHVPMGYERRGDATIFYGLGNFLYPPYQEMLGYEFRWHPASRQGVLACGTCEDGRWTWVPQEIRFCRRGLPRLAEHGRCPDYGQTLPAAAEEYEALYPRLRRRERNRYLAERMLFMSWQERWFRMKNLRQSVRSIR